MSDLTRCACGADMVGPLGWSAVYDGLAVEHTPSRCEIEEHRPLRFRFFRWLGSAIDDMRGPYRKTPRVRVWVRAPSPSGSAEPSGTVHLDNGEGWRLSESGGGAKGRTR